MIAVYASHTVSEENASKFIAAAADLIAATRKEKGNISYELVRGTADATLFAFMEKWADRESLDAHMQTEHFKTIVPQIKALAGKGSGILVHEVLI